MVTRFDKDTIEQMTDRCNEIIQNAVKKYGKNEVYYGHRKNVYFAAPWFDSKAKLIMTTCMKINELLKTRRKKYVFFPYKCQDNKPTSVFGNNISEMNNADEVIALISRKDVGTAFEIGYLYNKCKVTLLVYDESCMKRKTNLMLAMAADSVITMDNFADYLFDNISVESEIEIKDEWEDIE